MSKCLVRRRPKQHRNSPFVCQRTALLELIGWLIDEVRFTTHIVIAFGTDCGQCYRFCRDLRHRKTTWIKPAMSVFFIPVRKRRSLADRYDAALHQRVEYPVDVSTSGLKNLAAWIVRFCAVDRAFDIVNVERQVENSCLIV